MRCSLSARFSEKSKLRASVVCLLFGGWAELRGGEKHTPTLRERSEGVMSGSDSAWLFVTMIRTTVHTVRAFFNAARSDFRESKRHLRSHPSSPIPAASPNWISAGVHAIATIASQMGQLMWRVTRGQAGRGEEGSAQEPRLGPESKHSEVLAFISKKASTLSTSPVLVDSEFDNKVNLDTTRIQATDPRKP